MKLKIGHRCPECKQNSVLQRSRAKGFWEQKILLRIGLKPFRCSACGCRITSFNDSAVSNIERSQAMNPSRGRLPADDQAFQAMILEIRRTEEQMNSKDAVNSKDTVTPRPVRLEDALQLGERVSGR